MSESAYQIVIGILVLIIVVLLKRGGNNTETEVEKMQRLAEISKRSSAMAPEIKAKIGTLIEQNNLIEAIKLFRTETGAGLKESKEAVEAMQRGEMK